MINATLIYLIPLLLRILQTLLIDFPLDLFNDDITIFFCIENANSRNFVDDVTSDTNVNCITLHFIMVLRTLRYVVAVTRILDVRINKTLHVGEFVCWFFCRCCCCCWVDLLGRSDQKWAKALASHWEYEPTAGKR